MAGGHPEFAAGDSPAQAALALESFGHARLVEETEPSLERQHAQHLAVESSPSVS
jgi:hypothetical protein